MEKSFDILVVGGGHAGIEAAQIATQFGLKVGLISLPSVPLASAPCNPCIGGVAKGHVAREVDALGGVMGKLADLSGIQYRTLNESKGYAVQSTRVQIDKELYAENAKKLLSQVSNLEIIPDKITQISTTEEGYCVRSEDWSYRTKKLIVTVGTFLAGKLHCGSDQIAGGRRNSESSVSMNDLFADIKTLNTRFKTGTPPRLKKHSIDFSKLEVQPSDPNSENLHLLHDTFSRHVEQMDCYLGRTNSETMRIIRDNKEKSPMYNGQINAVGARYCPSIEDKAYRYPDKDIHHVFVEPEGLNLETYYPSGISSSLPKDVQEEFVRTIEGLENVEIAVHGYAVEYDVVDTTELSLTLEHKKHPGLYFSGQVNGTSGYEEAAGQGIIAGINAALSIFGRNPLILDRKDSYIGVMIDDLVTKTRDEPYRLFTARSENRLYIREDNTFLRICPYRSSLGLKTVLDEKISALIAEYKVLKAFVHSFEYKNSAAEAEMFHVEHLFHVEQFISSNDQKVGLEELLRMPQQDPVELLRFVLEKLELAFDPLVIKAVAIETKYDGYIKRADQQTVRMDKLARMRLNVDNLLSSENISFECKQRIAKIRPETFGQLQRMNGIRPATLAVVASGNL